MESGIGLIANERQEQITKHQQSILDDVNENSTKQLAIAVLGLLDRSNHDKPLNWDEKRWQYMVNKSYKERLIIAGALLAAELDRIIYLEKH